MIEDDEKELLKHKIEESKKYQNKLNEGFYSWTHKLICICKKD